MRSNWNRVGVKKKNEPLRNAKNEKMKEANDVKTWQQEKADGETINHPQYKIIIKITWK